MSAPVCAAGELIGSRAHVVLDRKQFDMVLGPCIYATFKADGRCQYVGMAVQGLQRPLQPKHSKLRDGDWDQLFVWRVKHAEALEELERQAIDALCPLDNSNPPSPLGIRKVAKYSQEVRYRTTGDIAKELGVTRKFVVGEILDERLEALKRESANGRTIYRIHPHDFAGYMRLVWRPTSKKRLAEEQRSEQADVEGTQEYEYIVERS